MIEVIYPSYSKSETYVVKLLNGKIESLSSDNDGAVIEVDKTDSGQKSRL